MNKGSSNFKYAGRWRNNPDIDLVEIDGMVYALNGWNGKQYTDCWKCSGAENTEIPDERYVITPVYEEISISDVRIIAYQVKQK